MFLPRIALLFTTPRTLHVVLTSQSHCAGICELYFGTLVARFLIYNTLHRVQCLQSLIYALTSLRFLGPINWNFWSKMCLPSPQTSTTTEDQQCDQIYTICIKAPTYWDTRKRWLGWEEGGEGDLVIRPEARHYGHWSALAAWTRY